MAVLCTRGTANTDDFRDLLQRGFQFHQRGQYAESVPLLRRAWKLEPKDYFANFLLGVDLLRTGKRAEAAPFLTEASRQRPEEEFPYEYLAEAQAGLGQYAEAAIAYSKAVQVAPKSAQATMALVDYSLARFGTIARQLRSSNAGMAAAYRLQASARPLTDPVRRDLLRQASELDPDSPGVWSELAIVDIAKGNLAAATQDVDRAKAKNPSDLRAWEAEALIAAHKGDRALATERLNAIARRSRAALAQTAADWPAGLQPQPPSADPERVTGKPAQALFNEQRWEALASMPAPAADQPKQWYYRGTALARTGDCDAAIPALERGLGPGGTEAMYHLSLCYARQAGEIERRVEQAGGDPTLIHLMRGDVLLRLQANSEAAVKEYEAAVTTGPQRVGALERLAEAQLGAGQMEAARQSAEAALRLDPHRPSAVRTMAEIAMQERNYAAALPYLRQLAAADPADAGTRVQIGTACAQTGCLDEALQNLAPVLKQGYPDQKGSLHYLLGTVLRRLGRQAEAAQAFEAARQISDAFQRTAHRDQDERR